MGETAASNVGRPGRRRQEALPTVAIAIAAAAGWLALYLGCAAVNSDRHLRRGIRLAAIVAERLAERSEIA